MGQHRITNDFPRHELPPRSHNRLCWLAVLAITLAGAGVRAVHLEQPMRFDEAFTFQHYARQPLWDVVSNYSEPNNHLLHTLLAHVSIGLFGPRAWALRLPVFLFGLALVPLSYLCVRRLAGRRTALLTCGLIAGWPYLVHYSTNARGYIIQCAVFLPMLVLARDLAARPRWRPAIAMAGLAALGMYAVPTMLYGLATLSVWMLMIGWQANRHVGLRAAFKSLLMLWPPAMLLTLLLYAPVLFRLGGQAVTGNRFVQPLTWTELLREGPLPLLETWGKWHIGLVVPPLIMVTTVLFVVGAGRLWLGRRDLSLLLPATVVTVLPMVAAMRRIPPSRTWIFLLPAMLIAVAAGLDAAVNVISRRRWAGLRQGVAWGAATVALTCGLWTWASGAVFRAADTATYFEAEQVHDWLAGQLEADDAVACICPCDSPLIFYFAQNGKDLPMPPRPRRVFVVTHDGDYPDDVDRVLRESGLRPQEYHDCRKLQQFGCSAVHVVAAMPQAACGQADPQRP